MCPKCNQNPCICSSTSLSSVVTLTHENVIDTREKPAFVALVCTTAGGKNLKPLDLAGKYAAEGFDSLDQGMKKDRFAMVIAVNLYETFLPKIEKKKEVKADGANVNKKPADEKPVPIGGEPGKTPKLELDTDEIGVLDEDFFIVTGNEQARLILKQSGKEFQKKGKLSELEQQLSEVAVQIEKFEGFPVLVVGFLWRFMWKYEELDQPAEKEAKTAADTKIVKLTDAEAAAMVSENKAHVFVQSEREKLGQVIPYGRVRARAITMCRPFCEFFQKRKNPVFIHLGDSDPVNLSIEREISGCSRAGLFSRFALLLDEHQQKEGVFPLIATGGYDFEIGGEEEGRTSQWNCEAADLDMEVRVTMFKKKPRTPYFPEPNLLLHATNDCGVDFLKADFGKSNNETLALFRWIDRIISNADDKFWKKLLVFDRRATLVTHAGRMHETMDKLNLFKMERILNSADIWTVVSKLSLEEIRFVETPGEIALLREIRDALCRHESKKLFDLIGKQKLSLSEDSFQIFKEANSNDPKRFRLVPGEGGKTYQLFFEESPNLLLLVTGLQREIRRLLKFDGPASENPSEKEKAEAEFYKNLRFDCQNGRNHQKSAATTGCEVASWLNAAYAGPFALEKKKDEWIVRLEHHTTPWNTLRLSFEENSEKPIRLVCYDGEKKIAERDFKQFGPNQLEAFKKNLQNPDRRFTMDSLKLLSSFCEQPVLLLFEFRDKTGHLIPLAAQLYQNNKYLDYTLNVSLMPASARLKCHSLEKPLFKLVRTRTSSATAEFRRKTIENLIDVVVRRVTAPDHFHGQIKAIEEFMVDIGLTVRSFDPDTDWLLKNEKGRRLFRELVIGRHQGALFRLAQSHASPGAIRTLPEDFDVPGDVYHPKAVYNLIMMNPTHERHYTLDVNFYLAGQAKELIKKLLEIAAAAEGKLLVERKAEIESIRRFRHMLHRHRTANNEDFRKNEAERRHLQQLKELNEAQKSELRSLEKELIAIKEEAAEIGAARKWLEDQFAEDLVEGAGGLREIVESYYEKSLAGFEALLPRRSSGPTDEASDVEIYYYPEAESAPVPLGEFSVPSSELPAEPGVLKVSGVLARILREAARGRKTFSDEQEISEWRLEKWQVRPGPRDSPVTEADAPYELVSPPAKKEERKDEEDEEVYGLPFDD